MPSISNFRLVVLLTSQHQIVFFLVGSSGVFVFEHSRALVSRFWQSFRRLSPSKAGWSFKPTSENTGKSFSSKLQLSGRKKTRTCQAQVNLHDQPTKVKLLVLKLGHFYISHGGEVTLSYEMPMTRVLSNVTGEAQLCVRYVNTASEVQFHVHSGTNERKNKAPLWKPVKARKIGLTLSLPGDFCSRNPKWGPFATLPLL